MVCDYRPLKDEPYRVRLTIGGDRLDYEKEIASPANLLETKLLLNSVTSDAHKGAKFLGIDIKDFFLLTYLPGGERKITWKNMDIILYQIPEVYVVISQEKQFLLYVLTTLASNTSIKMMQII